MALKYSGSYFQHLDTCSKLLIEAVLLWDQAQFIFLKKFSLSNFILLYFDKIKNLVCFQMTCDFNNYFSWIYYMTFFLLDKLANFDHLFKVLKKCKSKFDCLLYEMLYIRDIKPNLNTQRDSIRAKLFT